MVTAKTQYSLTNAKNYFTEHLCVGDYYEEGQRVAGQWFGLGAERRGLAGKVQAEDFLRLCENQHPSTGETLTQRLKGTRTEHGQVAANRRIFYDFTFSPPKAAPPGWLHRRARPTGTAGPPTAGRWPTAPSEMSNSTSTRFPPPADRKPASPMPTASMTAPNIPPTAKQSTSTPTVKGLC